MAVAVISTASKDSSKSLREKSSALTQPGDNKVTCDSASLFYIFMSLIKLKYIKGIVFQLFKKHVNTPSPQSKNFPPSQSIVHSLYTLIPFILITLVLWLYVVHGLFFFALSLPLPCFFLNIKYKWDYKLFLSFWIISIITTHYAFIHIACKRQDFTFLSFLFWREGVRNTSSNS